MDRMINKQTHVVDREQRECDPFAELDRFLAAKPLSRGECPDVIAWFGVSPCSVQYIQI
jgi:hypothetical protein